ncbi:TOBE domain-containing protein [Herbaspirillum sp. alder98]|uniref:TOBE domain-containing protein n=1 Tax=Herbaspirillum sp. alder98 TaxID=2913096 RepID=UPI0039BCBBE2
MNIVPLAHTAGGLVIEGSAGPVVTAGRADEQWNLGLRPEHIRLDDSGVAASVHTIEYFGADTIIGARVGLATLLVRVPGQLALRVGDQVRLAWQDRDQTFFDQRSGMRRH